MSDVRKSPLRPHDFIEVRMQSGAIYATVGQARMPRPDELPDMVMMLLRGLDAGRALAREAAATAAATAAGAATGAATAAEDVDSPDAPDCEPPTHAASPPEDYAKTCLYALAFWSNVLNGLAQGVSLYRCVAHAFTRPERTLCFLVGERTWLNIKPTAQDCGIVCVDHEGAYGPLYTVNAGPSFDELRAFVLWLVRSAGFDAKAPPGWPDPPASETPPNNVGTLLWEEA